MTWGVRCAQPLTPPTPDMERRLGRGDENRPWDEAYEPLHHRGRLLFIEQTGATEDPQAHRQNGHDFNRPPRGAGEIPVGLGDVEQRQLVENINNRLHNSTRRQGNQEPQARASVKKEVIEPKALGPHTETEHHHQENSNNFAAPPSCPPEGVNGERGTGDKNHCGPKDAGALDPPEEDGRDDHEDRREHEPPGSSSRDGPPGTIIVFFLLRLPFGDDGGWRGGGGLGCPSLSNGSGGGGGGDGGGGDAEDDAEDDADGRTHGELLWGRT